MFTPEQILKFLQEVQALHAAQGQPAPQTDATSQQAPQPLTAEQLLALATLNQMNPGAGFLGTGGGYVQGGDTLVTGSGGLSNGKVFVPR